MRILVIEDSVRLASSLEQGLRRLGHAVDVTHDGEAGLSYARSNPYDLVLLDLLLPRIDGLTVLRRLREEGADVAVRMQEIVCGLLRLARITSGEDAPSREEVRLRPLVERLWTAFRAPAAARGLRLEDRTPPELCLRTDRTLLSVVITNLLDNAVRYAPPGSTIVSAVEVDAAGGVRWTLENGVGDLGPADVPRLAEPFWQKDHARSRPDHAGLGLSLVREVALVLGGEVTFAVDGVFLVSFVLPPEN